MEKNMKKIDTCITESVCCTSEIKHNIVSQLYVKKKKKKRGPTPGPQKTGIVINYEQKYGRIWVGKGFFPVASPKLMISTGSPLPTCFFPLDCQRAWLSCLFHRYHQLFYLGATPQACCQTGFIHPN